MIDNCFFVFVWAGEVAYFGKSFSDGRVVRFLVKECLPEDAGTYTCLAKNSAGRSSSCASVSVQGKRSQFDDSEHSESICVNTNLFRVACFIATLFFFRWIVTLCWSLNDSFQGLLFPPRLWNSLRGACLCASQTLLSPRERFRKRRSDNISKGHCTGPQRIFSRF